MDGPTTSTSWRGGLRCARELVAAGGLRVFRSCRGRWSGRPGSGLALLCAGSCLVLAPSSELEAQAVDGRVIEAGTGRGVSDVRVLLEDTTLGDSLTVTTDRSGAFELRLPRPGTYTLSATRLGYETARVDIAVAPGQRVDVELELTPRAVLLDSLYVAGSRVPIRHLGTWGGFQARYEERKFVGSARLFSRRDPEFRAAATVGDVVRSIARGPGVPGGCDDPVVFVDGIPLTGWSGERVLSMSSEWFRGIEYYRDPLSAPLEYREGTNPCGILAVWRR